MRGGNESWSAPIRLTVLLEASPIFFLGVTLTGVTLTGVPRELAGDCISFTDTLLGVFTGVLNIAVRPRAPSLAPVTTGLSLLGVFKIGLAFTPDFGVGGSGFMLKLTLLLGEKKSAAEVS